MKQIIFLIFFFINIILFTTGCSEFVEDNSTTTETNTTTTTTTETNTTATSGPSLIAITYQNYGAQNSANDDYLALMFDSPLLLASVPNSIADAFEVNGTGRIGSNSIFNPTSKINYTGEINLFYLQLKDGGTQNIPFIIGDSIQKKQSNSILIGTNGIGTPENSPFISVEGYTHFANLSSGSNQCINIENNVTTNVDDVIIVACDSADAYQTEGTFTSFDIEDRNFSANVTLVPNRAGLVDFDTNLQWRHTDINNSVTFDEAKIYCDNLQVGGITIGAIVLPLVDDWRVPTLEELLSIVDFGGTSGNIQGNFTTTASRLFWSSDSFVNTSDTTGWAIDFQALDTSITSIRDKNTTLAVRCVRDI